ncbi:MAG: hypothetical protein HY744_20805 [Deltaproteobacteria bacterium]|nr:hypothetical protein [Deltaproteobacteria bacterium]
MGYRVSPLAAFALFGLVVSGAAGCGKQKKIEECNALVAVINAGVDRMQKSSALAADGGAAVDELKAVAEVMDGAAAEASKVKLSVPELRKIAGDYQAMAKQVAAGARELAEAVEKVDPDKMKAAQEKVDKAVKLEDPLVDELNKFCRAP